MVCSGVAGHRDGEGRVRKGRGGGRPGRGPEVTAGLGDRDKGRNERLRQSSVDTQIDFP